MTAIFPRLPTFTHNSSLYPLSVFTQCCSFFPLQFVSDSHMNWLTQRISITSVSFLGFYISCLTIILSFCSLFSFFKDFIYLFLEGKRGRKWTETSMCGCLSRTPHWGPGPQPRQVPAWELNQ